MTLKVDLERCLRSPYLSKDETKPPLASQMVDAGYDLLEQARVSFDEEDEVTGLKQAWGAMYRAGKGLVYAAGYDVDRLDCLELVLRVHYVENGLDDADIEEFRRAQELVGTPEEALTRAERFLEKVSEILRTVGTTEALSANGQV